MLVVLAEEHRNNFWQLCATANEVEAAHASGRIANDRGANLLRFYAAEVGLKYLINKINKIPFKHEAPKKAPSVEGYSHDIIKMVSDLKVPAGRVSAPPKQHHSCVGGYNDGSGGQTFEVKHVHEAWRYGLTVKQEDSLELAAYFSSIINYLNQEIAR